ncbi:unknown [Acidaminococcus sp. CAG:542]|nr:unknown [Acidaminococcus sp. CAG:542]
MVQFQFVPGIVDVVVGDVGIQLHFNHRIRSNGFVRVPPVLEGVDGLFQQPAVQVETHSGNLAVLFRPQQVPGAPDFQIPHGDFEPGPQFRKVPDGLEPFLGHFTEYPVLFVQEIGVGQPGGPSHPPPHLVQLGEAEVFRTVDDDGIGQRHVQAVFDNGGAQEHIEIPVVEAQHHVFQFVLAHPSVGHTDGDPRDQFPEMGGDPAEPFDPVVDVIDPSAPADFPFQGFPDHPVIVFRHIGFHRQTVFGRRFDDTHVPSLYQGQVEGPGNGGGGQGQYVYAGTALFDFFFLGHPEPLFLVDDQKPQVVEFHIRVQDPVGSDEHIDFAFRHLFHDLFLLFGGPEPTEHFHPDSEGPHPLGEGQEMLLGQHCGGGQHRHLFPVHDRLEGGPDGYFRLPIAHVPAQEPFHGYGLFHVRLDFGDGFQLVGGFLKGETVLEFLLPVGIRSKGMARGDFPLGIEPEQFRGQDGNGLLGLPGGLLPVFPAHVGQFGRGALVAHVFVEEPHLFHRHVELVPLGILELEIVPVDPVHFNGFHPHVPADALYIVDHVIPHLDVGEIVESRSLSLGFHQTAFFLHAENVAFGKQQPFFIPEIEPVGKASLEDHSSLVRHFLELAGKGHGKARPFQAFRQACRLVPGPHHDQGMDSLVQPALQVFLEQVGVLVVGGHGPDLDMEFGGFRKIGMAQITDRHQVAFPGLEEHGLRLQQLVGKFPVVPEAFPAFFKKGCRFIQHRQLVRGQVLEQGGADFLALDRQGHDSHLFDGADAPLGVQVEMLHGIDGVVEPFDPHRILAVDGKHVQDVPPDGHLAQGIHLFRPFIAGFHQLFHHQVLADFLAHCQFQVFPDQGFRGRQFLDGGFGGGKDDPRFFPDDHFQGRCPLRHDLFVPGIHLAVDQAGRIQFPHGQIRIEIGQFPALGPDAFPVHRQDHQRPGRLEGFLQGAQKPGFHRSCEAGKLDGAGFLLPEPGCILDIFFLLQQFRQLICHRILSLWK